MITFISFLLTVGIIALINNFAEIQTYGLSAIIFGAILWVGIRFLILTAVKKQETEPDN